MTELEALNLCLRAIGSNVVNDFETLHPDAFNARATLDRSRKKFQRRGWWFNIDYNIVYQPDPVTNEIIIGDNITTFIAECNSIIERGGKLYDKVNQTTQFTTNVIAIRTVKLLDWDDMPESVQEYCAYLSAAEFVRDEIEDPAKEQSFKESAGISMLDIKKEDLEHGRYNMFDSARVRQASAGVQPYIRTNKRFYGDPDV